MKVYLSSRYGVLILFYEILFYFGVEMLMEVVGDGSVLKVLFGLVFSFIIRIR